MGGGGKAVTDNVGKYVWGGDSVFIEQVSIRLICQTAKKKYFAKCSDLDHEWFYTYNFPDKAARATLFKFSNRKHCLPNKLILPSGPIWTMSDLILLMTSLEVGGENSEQWFEWSDLDHVGSNTVWKLEVNTPSRRCSCFQHCFTFQTDIGSAFSFTQVANLDIQ